MDAGPRDRRFVQVEAIHGRRGVSARDGDGGPPHAARDISDARAGRELLVHVGDLWEVLGGERAHQPGPVEVPLRLDIVGPLHGDALAGPVRVDELREHAAKGRQRTAEGRHRVRALRIDQGLGVPGRKGETPLLLRLLRVVHLHDPGSGLLLEPLPRVAGIDAGAFGELAGRERPVRGQHAVEAQAIPQVDGEHVHRAQGRREQTLHEPVANLIRAGHRAPLSCGGRRDHGTRSAGL